MLRLSLSIPPDALSAEAEALRQIAAGKLGIPTGDITKVNLRKKSVDARAGRPLLLQLTLDIETPQEDMLLQKKLSGLQKAPDEKPRPALPKALPRLSHRPVVVGMGPAGLFTAKALCDAGMPPILVERGQPVEQRSKDINAFFGSGPLLPESNVQFGEGGAGTFSDGKLTTGIKSPFIREILDTFVSFGAPEEILWQARPHIGTDRLRTLLPRFRESLVSAGATLRFGTRLKDITVEQGALRAVVLAGADGSEEVLPCEALFLAIGHSARDTLEMLHSHNLSMEQKPFSLGVRIEHPQQQIDAVQYGRHAGHPALGAADYKLAVHLPNGRGVYTFCMCPGGAVVASASEPGGICVNGMSQFARSLPNANSAVLVGIVPGDFPDASPLAGIALQRRWERAAFEMAGSSYHAPAQLVGDFLKSQPSTGPGDIIPSHRPGVTWGDLSACLPDFAQQALRQALPLMARKLRGFDRADAVLTGPETRSSSPVRLLRDAQTGQSLSHPGIYPVGEGAGYAGGITSSAVDGIQSALRFLASK